MTNPLTLEQHPESKIAQLGVWYPRSEGSIDTVQVSLFDVRASDGFRFRYDFKRDGWSILQSDEEGDWQETQFVQSWARDPEFKEHPALKSLPWDNQATPVETAAIEVNDKLTLTPPVIPT